MTQSGLCNLNGLGVLVTRPQHQAKRLYQLIKACGGRPLLFPALEITEPDDSGPAHNLLAQINNYPIAIFISPNAVTRCLEMLGDQGLPDTLQLAAVGRGTADTLAYAGYTVNIVPEQHFDSEALLETAELTNVQGKSVLIVRGVGGRAHLGDTLKSRGASVDYAEVYQRRIPNVDPQPLLQRWVMDVGVVTVTSLQILDNLWHLLGEQGQALFLETPLLVVSERIRAHARELGFRQVLLAPKAEDRAIVTTLCGWMSGSPL